MRLLVGLLDPAATFCWKVWPGLDQDPGRCACLAQAIDTGFSRNPIHSDMLPADVIGTEVFNPRDATYSIKKGPVSPT